MIQKLKDTWNKYAGKQGHTWLAHEEINFYWTLATSQIVAYTLNILLAIVPGIGLWAWYLYREGKHGKQQGPDKVWDQVPDYYYATKGFATGWLVSLALYFLAQVGFNAL